MKIVKVTKCLECPNCEIGSVWITSAVTIYPGHCVFGKWERTETGMRMTDTSRKPKKIRNVNIIPSWCPLEDYKEKSTIPEPYPDDASLGGEFF